ncbi:MAG TPA: hypothetical protein VMU36_08550 [Spirochaetia bacterium]|nr:hypothetical protein [Spirochaetia bacterium]
MKASNLFIVLGQIALAVSIVLNHFVKDSAPVSFAIGLLTGLSIVLNAAVIVAIRKRGSGEQSGD